MAVTYTTINGYKVPVYSQDVFKPWQKAQYGTVDNGDGMSQGVTGYTDAWGLDMHDSRAIYDDPRYGDWTQWSLLNPGQGAGNGGGNGFDIDPNGFDAMLKIADKEGARFRYTLKDGQYVPQYIGNQGWNSNEDNTGLATALTMIAGGALAGMAGAAAGTGSAAGSTAGSAAGAASPMTTWGVLDTSLALPGTTFTAGGAGGLTMLPTVGNPTSYAMSPSALAGDALGTTAGGTFGGSGLLNGAGELLTKIGPENLMKMGGLLGGALGGGAAGQSGSPGDPYGNVTPVATPQMYGGTGGMGAPPTFNTVGNTETERRMTQQYLPSLFPKDQQGAPTSGIGMGPLGSYAEAVRRGLLPGGASGGLLGGMVPPVRRSLLGQKLPG